MLSRALWAQGARGYRRNVTAILGSPDLVFARKRLAIFCDGDFWHGRNWAARKRKLEMGHNSRYWIAKIERNIQRDKSTRTKLRQQGWLVLRCWEGDIKADPAKVAVELAKVISRRQAAGGS